MTDTPEPADDGAETDIGGSGYTLSALAEYLDAGRTPAIAAIERNPECLAALAQLARLRMLGGELLDDDASASAGDGEWMRSLLDAVGFESRAGRDIPLDAIDPGLVITEGAVREAIREAADGIPGLLVGRCTLGGPIRKPDDEISVSVTISVVPDRPLADYVAEIRSAITLTIARHTELRLRAVDVTVTDVHGHPSDGGRA